MRTGEERVSAGTRGTDAAGEQVDDVAQYIRIHDLSLL